MAFKFVKPHPEKVKSDMLSICVAVNDPVKPTQFSKALLPT